MLNDWVAHGQCTYVYLEHFNVSALFHEDEYESSMMRQDRITLPR